ncbi:MAG: hypothetical protein OJF51_002354 [Nitrospira sp.]|jgi:hypothetical protein|nr:MAG: hypothetical protein OJF51_002354 [Nitrospira sp.]
MTTETPYEDQMRTSVLHCKKKSIRLLYAQAIADLQHRLSGGYSQVREAYLLYHLIAIPCALILDCAVWLGNRIMPRIK